MLRLISAIALGVVVAVPLARAGATSKGQQAYDRGYALYENGDFDGAIVEYSKALELDPNYDRAYWQRCRALAGKGESDRAITDCNKAIKLYPKHYAYYGARGYAWYIKGNFDRAIVDFSKSIQLSPEYANAYFNRGNAYLAKGDVVAAQADFAEVARLEPDSGTAELGQARIHVRKGNHDLAIAEFSKAIRLDSSDPEGYAGRAAAYEAKQQVALALADYRAALELPARSYTERQAHAEARRRLAALGSTPEPRRPESPAPKLATTGPGQRVALVIANSNYTGVVRLSNPANDGRAISASLRRLAFAEVIEHYDLGYAAMVTALREFGDRASSAEWAVVYFAGHGIEINGSTYLIPVDAKLERDTHVTDETVALSRVLEKVESAQKLRLVILDACRNNPFVARMIRSTATRSVGRGLAQIEPEGGVLVAYSAKHGTTAEDGISGNSPFAEALLAYLEEPGLEINFLFRKVRDEVLTKTARRQEPYLYGSLPSENLFFKHADAR